MGGPLFTPLPQPCKYSGWESVPKPGPERVREEKPRVCSIRTGQAQPRGRPHPTRSGLFAHTDRTWTYSFSGAFLFSLGFLVAGLCYLCYRYVTKPPLPPNSLVSSHMGWGQEREVWGGPQSSRGHRSKDPWLSLKCRDQHAMQKIRASFLPTNLKPTKT